MPRVSESEPKWLRVATPLIGTKEYPGAQNNPLIMRWAKGLGRVLGITYTGDSVPWCGLFVAHCMQESGFTPPPIAVRASEWGKWGSKLDRGCPGAILVFTRSGGGHVGFYVSEDSAYYHVLGGNQGDAVSVTKIAKNRCSAIRWPPGAPASKIGSVVRTFDGKVSKNEA